MRTAAALREALAQWVRQPREMALANAACFVCLALPAALLPLLPAGPLRPAALVALTLWAWLAFSALCAVCALLAAGQPRPWAAVLAWTRAQWRERLASGLVGLAGGAWLGLSLWFYRGAPLPGWLADLLLGLLGAAALWLALALMLSLGVAAEGGRPWRAVWKASGLLPLAFAPTALAAAAVFGLALGLPALLVGLRHWSARLWLAPLVLAPFFTGGFLAAFLTALVRGLLDEAQGRPPQAPPTWRELWNPWR